MLGSNAEAKGGIVNLDGFKPKTGLQKWGFALILCGVFLLVTGILLGLLSVGSLLIFSFFYILLGLYIFTAKGPQSLLNKHRASKADANQKAIEAALGQLEHSSGAQAFIAYEKLKTLVVKKNYTGTKSIDELLESINFESSRVESRFIGSLTNPAASAFGSASSRKINIYQDWVVAGDLGYDFDISTRGQVNLDGSIQIGKNNSQVDTRTATLQLATQDWSHAFKILPHEADEARRILNQLEAIIESLKPKGLTVADVQDAMKKLLDNSGKSPAEKLEELSNLRYQRLLSDQEFELAKSKILGI
jgi:hypothetical protein